MLDPDVPKAPIEAVTREIIKGPHKSYCCLIFSQSRTTVYCVQHGLVQSVRAAVYAGALIAAFYVCEMQFNDKFDFYPQNSRKEAQTPFETMPSSLKKNRPRSYLLKLLLRQSSLINITKMQLLGLLYLVRGIMTAVSTSEDYNYIYIASSSSISMSRDGSVYSAIDNGINYFRKINNTYTYITKFYPLCTSTGLSCSTTKQVMTYDGSRILAYSSNDNFLRVYKIVNDTVLHSQQIPASGVLLSRFQVKEDFLLLSSTTYMQYYAYNHTSGLYQLIYSGNYPAAQTGATFSTDGRYILTYSSSFQTYIYSYDGVTFTVPTTPQQIPLVNGTVTLIYDFKLEQLNSTAYSLIICFTATSTGSTRYLHFYTMTAGGFIFTQQIDYSNFLLYSVYITKNAKYLAQGVIPNSLRFYELDEGSGQYFLVFHSYNFITNYPSNIYIAEDGSFLYGNIGSHTAFFFKCTLPYCSQCLSLNQCLVCAGTFTLTSTNTCTCSSTQTLLNSSCIDCNITLCSSCSANSLCSGCAKGFSLVNNSCLCPSGSSTSYLDGSCVSCNVDGCLRCDQSNICALFEVKQRLASGANSSNAQTTLLGLLVGVLVVLILGMVYLLIKVQQIINNMSKTVGPEQSRADLQNQESIDKAGTIVIEQGEAPSTHFTQQMFETTADLDMKPSKARRRNMRNHEQSQEENISLQKFMEKIQI